MMNISILIKLKTAGFPFKQDDAFTPPNTPNFVLDNIPYVMPTEADFFKELSYDSFQLHCLQNSLYFCSKESDPATDWYYESPLVALANYYLKLRKS